MHRLALASASEGQGRLPNSRLKPDEQMETSNCLNDPLITVKAGYNEHENFVISR